MGAVGGREISPSHCEVRESQHQLCLVDTESIQQDSVDDTADPVCNLRALLL